jgi:hypothetical protein
VFIASVHSTELICAPYFEAIGLSADIGKSSIEILQSKMKKQADERQLIMPSENYIVATDNINQQIFWAKNNGCLYLQQTTLTQFEKNIQVSTRLMNLNTGNYVFKNTYKANSIGDLPLILEQLGNTLQHPEFAETETKPNIADFKDSANRKYINQFGVSLGVLNLDNQNHLEARDTYLWDIRTLWIEAIFGVKVGTKDALWSFEPGIRILYPFSSKYNTFYMCSGGGFSMKEKAKYSNDYSYYGMFVENSLGYLVWRNNRLPMRIEAVASAVFYEKKAIGGGLRITTGILTANEKLNAPSSQEHIF